MAPPMQRLHVRLLKASVRRVDHALEGADELTWYDLKAGLGFDGRLYVAPPKQGPPAWLRFVQTGIQGRLAEVPALYVVEIECWYKTFSVRRCVPRCSLCSTAPRSARDRLASVSQICPSAPQKRPILSR